MRRIATVALLAAPLMLGTAGMTSANDGPGTFGMGCFGNCLRMFPHIHQHGPLFNYGPYYGYPPFEPYGYWNAYLHYTGPVPTPNTGGDNTYGWRQGGGGAGHSFGGFLHKAWGHGHSHSSGCSSCGSAAANVVTSGNAIERYNGVGSPAASAAFYADSPTTIISAGYIGR